MNRPTPAIVTQAAVRRLPRWALLLFCAAYVLPGFVGRQPWRQADMAAFGTMRELAAGATDWLRPLLAGMAPDTEGLLPYWLGALALQLAPQAWDPALVARVPFVALLAVALAATWYATYHLARHPRAQPVAFAFGGEAQPSDYARAVADGALLALIACLGLAQPSHETTAYLAQLAATALLLYGLAALPYRGATPLLALATGLVGLVLSGAPAMALLFGAGGTLLVALDVADPDALRSRRGQALAVAAATLVALALALGLDVLRWRVDFGTDGGRGGLSLARLLLWFTWPAWPLALWTLWRWRRQWLGREPHRHILLPLGFAVVAVAATLLSEPADRALLLGLPALAVLAAFALPTFGRSASALVDWFTLLFFSGAAIVVWVVWVAMMTGVPRQPAANVAKLAPGFEPVFSAPAFAVALLATAAWAALVAWRVGRHRAALWKTLVLPAGGAALGWLLLMTLWLPLLDYARSYVPLVRNVQQHTAGATGCVAFLGLTRGEVAAFGYHAGFAMQPYADGSACRWLLAAPELRGTLLRADAPAAWQLLGGARRPGERSDSLLVYRRRD